MVSLDEKNELTVTQIVPFSGFLVYFYRKMEEDYDVAVVGAGLAGLRTSILLQNEGYRVVLLEANSVPYKKCPLIILSVLVGVPQGLSGKIIIGI